MRVLRADLHIHTCLSPCADRSMRPVNVVAMARRQGLDVIAICDHNSAENAAATQSVAEVAGIAVIGGMEITSREEVHLLALLPDDGALTATQTIVYAHLPGENAPEIFGAQWVVDDQDRLVAENPRLLIGATDLSLGEVVDLVHGHGGLAIASHVDRPSFSLLSQLGFVPDDLALDGIEVCAAGVEDPACGLAVIRSSDAHRPEEIGCETTGFLVENGSLAEIALALRGEGGRRVVRTG